jgi:hypothetical protein
MTLADNERLSLPCESATNIPLYQFHFIVARLCVKIDKPEKALN